jgi:hypothetical protein
VEQRRLGKSEVLDKRYVRTKLILGRRLGEKEDGKRLPHHFQPWRISQKI